MDNTRRVKIADFIEGKLEDIVHNLSVIFGKHPTAYVAEVDYEDDYHPLEVCKDVSKTQLDRDLQEAREEYSKILTSPIEHFVVVISQDTPISEETINNIKNDGLSNEYVLSFGGKVLSRRLTLNEVRKNDKNREDLSRACYRKIMELVKLQYEQDKKYLM